MLANPVREMEYFEELIASSTAEIVDSYSYLELRSKGGKEGQMMVEEGKTTSGGKKHRVSGKKSAQKSVRKISQKKSQSGQETKLKRDQRLLVWLIGTNEYRKVPVGKL